MKRQINNTLQPKEKEIMTHIDFSSIGDVTEYNPVPDGKYLVRVHNVESSQTVAGDPMWKVTLQVVDGTHAGRRIFDNLVFSSAALTRAKHICSALGLDVSGSLDLEPKLIWDRRCIVSVVAKDYVDRDGHTKSRNEVLFAGYEPAEAMSSTT